MTPQQSGSPSGAFWKALALTGTVIVLTATPARANEWALCTTDTTAVEEAIAACTRLITGRTTLNTTELGLTYYNRGVWYQQSGRDAEALADYDESIRIDPKAKTYNNRGNIWKK